MPIVFEINLLSNFFHTSPGLSNISGRVRIYITFRLPFFPDTVKSNKTGVGNEDRKIVDNIVNEIRKGKVLRRLSMKRKVTDAEIAAEGNRKT